MRERVKIIIGFFKKEFAQVLRDPVMRVFIFVVPVVQLTLLGYAISNEFKNLKLAVYHTPSDYAARRLSESFYASGWFVRADSRGMLPEEVLQSNRADAALVMQKEGLTKALGRGGAKIQLLIDATNANKARAIESYAKAIVRKFTEKNYPEKNFQLPITFDMRVMFNPTMETSFFMVPGIMTIIICLVTIILTSMSIAREKEMGTLETIVAAPLRNMEIILGKTLPYVVLGLMDAFIVISGGLLIFGVPVRGSFLLMLAATVIFVVTTVSIGMFISTITKNQQQAMMGSFLFLFPAILMSGLFFPIANMPGALKIFAYANPLMYFIKILRNIMLKGANPQLVFTNMGILFLMALAIVSFSAARFRQTLN